MTRSLRLVALLTALAITMLTTPAAHPQTRVDLFDKNSRRTGSATIDERTGRIDFYDVKSSRTGYGKVDPRSGSLESFDLKGNRTGSGRITPPSRSIR
jgi:hypothetical protein